jgi:hypothetical protein
MATGIFRRMQRSLSVFLMKGDAAPNPTQPVPFPNHVVV